MAFDEALAIMDGEPGVHCGRSPGAIPSGRVSRRGASTTGRRCHCCQERQYGVNTL